MNAEHDQSAADAEPIRRFLAERFLFDPDAVIDQRSSLLGEGVLDSTGAMELVLFLEERYRIEVADHELVPANLDSIERIALFVVQKRAIGVTQGVQAMQPAMKVANGKAMPVAFPDERLSVEKLSISTTRDSSAIDEVRRATSR